MINEKFQVRLNGRNLFPYGGLTKPNQRLARLHDTFGECTAPPGSNDIGLSHAANHVAANTLGMIGSFDWKGFEIGDRVNDLQIEYERTGIYDAGAGSQDDVQYNKGFEMLFLGEVSKSIVRDGNSYKVMYN